MRDSAQGAIQATVNVEVLQEVLHYYHKGGRTQVGLALFDDLLASLPEPFGIDRETSLVARELLSHYPSLQSRDAFHAATVFQYGLEGIISTDKGFDVIAGLTRFDPRALAAT
jgi:predicted nucleic acid-binding protein